MKGLCPDCNQMHTADEPCRWICTRCDEILGDPAEAEGCRDRDCPMNERSMI